MVVQPSHILNLKEGVRAQNPWHIKQTTWHTVFASGTMSLRQTLLMRWSTRTTYDLAILTVYLSQDER